MISKSGGLGGWHLTAEVLNDFNANANPWNQTVAKMTDARNA
jgi:hypothetical protein